MSFCGCEAKDSCSALVSLDPMSQAWVFLFPPSICPQQSSRDPWQRGHSGHWAAPGCHFPVPTLLPPSCWWAAGPAPWAGSAGWGGGAARSWSQDVPVRAGHSRCAWWHFNVFLSKQPYPSFFLLFSKLPLSSTSLGFQTLRQRLLPCLLVETLKTGPAISIFISLSPLCFCPLLTLLFQLTSFASFFGFFGVFFCHRTTHFVTSLLKVT